MCISHFLTAVRYAPGIQSLAGANTSKSTRTGIERFPVVRWAPWFLSAFEPVHLTRNLSLKGLAVPRQSHSKHTTRRRRSAYVVSMVRSPSGHGRLIVFCAIDRAQHSHEIGLANLPFTRRGRRAQVEQEKARSARRRSDVEQNRASTSAPAAVSPDSAQQLEEPDIHPITPEIEDPPSEQTIDPALFGHDPATQFTSISTQPVQAVHQLPPAPAPPPSQPQQMMPPPPQPATLTQLAQMRHPQSLVQDEQARWDRMSVLFEHVRNAARTFEHAPPSVAALESVLIRMYLESPLNGSGSITRPSN